MVRMGRIGLAGVVVLLAAAGARAQPGFSPTPPAAPADSPGWTKFTEPGEGAYTVDVPQGWQAQGGVHRYAPSDAPAWLTARSPDGAVELFLGDPAIGAFFLPSQFSPEGSQMPGPHNRAVPVLRYRPGAEYASLYGMRSLQAVCQNVRLQGSQPMPKLEDDMRQNVQTATRIDAGEARFTCDRNGQPLTAVVDAGTALVQFPGGNGAGVWFVPMLRGFVAPVAQADQTAGILDHVTASFVPDPHFMAAIARASAAENPPPAPNPAPGPTPGPAPIPSPMPAPIRPVPQARACPDDLQQQRICNLNDGHLVVTGGCLKCL